MARNKRGQFVSEKLISIKIPKALQEIADDVAIRVRPIVRDELENTLVHEIYASRTPATEQGKKVQEYNETHKHQKKRPYHHTGLLERSIYGTIDGDVVKANVRDQRYDNGASTTDVYDYLKFGTTDNPKNDTYDYANGTEFSKYISQEPHNFEARTREYMNQFLDRLAADIKNHPERYSDKYKKRRGLERDKA